MDEVEDFGQSMKHVTKDGLSIKKNIITNSGKKIKGYQVVNFFISLQRVFPLLTL